MPRGVEPLAMNEDRKLWDLLGRTSRRAAPPFFAAKVMRKIETAERPLWFASLLRWLAPVTVAALVVFAVLPRENAIQDDKLTTLDLVEVLSPEDYDTLTSAGWPYDNDFLTASL